MDHFSDQSLWTKMKSVTGQLGWSVCARPGREHGNTERGRPTRKEGGGCYQKSERVTE